MHTEHLFIVAADGFLQGHDPGEMKKQQALIQLTGWSPKSRNLTKHLRVASEMLIKTPSHKKQALLHSFVDCVGCSDWMLTLKHYGKTVQVLWNL